MNSLQYINQTLNEDVNGNEIIQIKEKTLFEIENIIVGSRNLYLRFDEINLPSIDMNLSAIKSLKLTVYQTKMSDFSAFLNLEYLCISGVKIGQTPFENLHKLIKLDIYLCDLSEFDFDSLNSLTSLQIIEIDTDTDSKTFKIDLSRLINLKWLYLGFIEEQDENKLELITDSNNQLTKIVLNYKTIDFSKQLDLPELKCLRISEVNLNKQIRNQCFIGMSNLIELYLNYANLTNVGFLDTDRLGNLKLLDLSFNQIKFLRKGTFSKLKKLKELYLCDNKVKRFIPGVFEGLDLLEHLDISLNPFNVESIDKTSFDGLRRLKNLCINIYEMKFGNFDHLKRDGLMVY